MAIVGRMSKTAFEAILAKKVEEMARAAARREERERAEAARQHLAAAKAPLGSAVLTAEQVNGVASQLRQERREAEQTGLTRRLENGRWVSRETQIEAISTARDLERRGF